MKCPKCGEEMEEGYITLAGENAALYWSNEEPTGFWKRLDGKETLLRISILYLDKKHWLRKGFRCSNCKLITFEC